MEISYRFPCRLRVFRQNVRTCPSRKTDEKHESSVERSAEGKPSGQTPAHRSPLPQSSVSTTAKCCSIICWACWNRNSATFCNSGFRLRQKRLFGLQIKGCARFYMYICKSHCSKTEFVHSDQASLQLNLQGIPSVRLHQYLLLGGVALTH